MNTRTNVNIESELTVEFDELDEIKRPDAIQGECYQGEPRYSVIGTVDEQWGFVHSISTISQERFNEVEFEATLIDGDGFSVFNQKSKGAEIIFKGNRFKITPQDIGFIIGYRLALAKSNKKLSDAMYQCAKQALSPVCFKSFFEMIDWKKVNFYSLFEIVND
jgi:hypothetical protein